MAGFVGFEDFFDLAEVGPGGLRIQGGALLSTAQCYGFLLGSYIVLLEGEIHDLFLLHRHLNLLYLLYLEHVVGDGTRPLHLSSNLLRLQLYLKPLRPQSSRIRVYLICPLLGDVEDFGVVEGIGFVELDLPFKKVESRLNLCFELGLGLGRL